MTKLDSKQAKQPAVKPANARHAKVARQSRLGKLGSGLLRAVGVVAGAAVVVAIFAATTITGDINKGSITLLTSDGKDAVAPADFKGPINMLLVGSDTRKGVGNGFGTETSN
ncbi:MAG: hypothetical protein RL556_590, partial [Actinomycetota bacterium]